MLFEASSLLPLLQNANESGGGLASMLVPLLLMVAIFYFLLIRPQAKERKQQAAMRDALKKGDRVLTQGGILARVQQVKEKELVLELEAGARLRIRRDAVIHRIEEDGATKES